MPILHHNSKQEVLKKVIEISLETDSEYMYIDNLVQDCNN